MYVFGILVMLFILIWHNLGEGKCPNCGSRKTQPMNYETGKYCTNCYQRFE